MFTTIRKSWPALLLLLALYLLLPRMAAMDWYVRLTADYKGVGPMLLHWPLACFALCLVESYRHGASWVRPLLAGGMAAIPFLIARQDLGTILFFAVVYAVVGAFGEGIGHLVRRVQRRRS